MKNGKVYKQLYATPDAELPFESTLDEEKMENAATFISDWKYGKYSVRMCNGVRCL